MVSIHDCFAYYCDAMIGAWANHNSKHAVTNENHSEHLKLLLRTVIITDESNSNVQNRKEKLLSNPLSSRVVQHHYDYSELL